MVPHCNWQRSGGRLGRRHDRPSQGVITKDIAQASVGLNVDYFKVGTPYWVGAAAMGKYAFTDLFNAAARFELVSSKNGGYTAASPHTASHGLRGRCGALRRYSDGRLTVAKHFETRLEFRGDFANQDLFNKGGVARKNQFTGLVAFLAYF